MTWIPLDKLDWRDAIGRTARHLGQKQQGTILYFSDGRRRVCLATGTGRVVLDVASVEVKVRNFDRREVI